MHLLFTLILSSILSLLIEIRESITSIIERQLFVDISRRYILKTNRLEVA